MINDTTYRNTRNISYTNGIIWSYSNRYVYTSVFNSRVERSTTYGEKLYFNPTEDKTQTEKGGN